VASHKPVTIESASSDAAAFTLRAAGWTLLASGLLMAGLIWFNSSDFVVMATFSAVLCAMGAAAMALANRCAAPIVTGHDATEGESLSDGVASTRGWSRDCPLPSPTSE
jgi:hypothetical protein